MRAEAGFSRTSISDFFTSIRRFETLNRLRRTCVTRPSLAEPLSIGTRLWYHNTAQVAGEA